MTEPLYRWKWSGKIENTFKLGSLGRAKLVTQSIQLTPCGRHKKEQTGTHGLRHRTERSVQVQSREKRDIIDGW